MTTPTSVHLHRRETLSTITNTPSHPSCPNQLSPKPPTAKRKRIHSYSRPRFKLHTQDNNAPNPMPTPTLPTAISHQQPTSPDNKQPNCPELRLQQPLPPTQGLENPSVISLHPISHLACTDTIIAAASPTLLTCWLLNPSYPFSASTNTPFCHLQSQWQSPSDYHITSLSLAPDASALALSLQHADPPCAQSTIAIVLLDPLTCARLIRLSLPSSLSFMPPSRTAPSTNLSLVFFTCSGLSTHSPGRVLSRSSDLPAHLRYAFHQHGGNNTPQADFVPAFGLAVPLAKFDLAVAGSNGVAAVYRFTAGYARLFKYAAVDAVELFDSDAPIRMSTATQISSATPQRLTGEVACDEVQARPRLLSLCADKGMALFEDGVLALRMDADAFRPMAVCAFHRHADDGMDAVLLVCRNTNRPVGARSCNSRKPTREKDGRLAFALKSAKGSWKFVPLHNVREAELLDIKVFEEDRASLMVVVLCAEKKALQYRISLQKNGSFRVTPAEVMFGLHQILDTDDVNANNVLVRRRGHITEVSARGREVVVKTFIRPRDSTVP